MPLWVRTTSGKTMTRCGIKFGPEFAKVEDDVLKEKFASPMTPKNLLKAKTIGQIIKADTGLLWIDQDPYARSTSVAQFEPEAEAKPATSDKPADTKPKGGK